MGPDARRKMKDAESRLEQLEQMLKGLKGQASSLDFSGGKRESGVIRESKQNGRKQRGGINPGQIRELEKSIQLIKQRIGKR